MNVSIAKGTEYQGDFSSTSFPVLSSDWSASAAFYTVYPGTAEFTKPLVRNGNKFVLTLGIADTAGMTAGVYTFVVTFVNAVLGVTVNSVNYATVTDLPIFDVPMTKLFISISKADGSPAGTFTDRLVTTASGASIVKTYNGIQITVNNDLADKLGSGIVGTEKISTVTNQAGYAELFVIKGLTLVVTCPYFGKTVSVDTTGKDEIDLKEYF